MNLVPSDVIIAIVYGLIAVWEYNTHGKTVTPFMAFLAILILLLFV